MDMKERVEWIQSLGITANDITEVWKISLAQFKWLYDNHPEVMDSAIDGLAKKLSRTSRLPAFTTLYDLNAPRTRAMTVTEILEEMGIPPTRLAIRRHVPDIARALGVEGPRRSNGRKVYDMPPLRED